MRADASDSAALPAMRPVPNAGIPTGTDQSERVKACIDTPAITG
jgi:hypothetical protein